MATQVQSRRGTTSEHSTFTGAVGELTVDTTKDTVVVHDGSTAGGHPLLKESAIGSTVQAYDADTAKLDVAQTFTAVQTLVSPELTTSPYVNGSYRSNIVAVAALDVDCSAGNYFTKTINANSTFTFSNAPSSRAFGFTLEVTHTSGVITWPAAVKWPNDTAPSLTTGKTHLFMFVTNNGGTRWRGAALVNYVN
jgi:hypothetical protein